MEDWNVKVSLFYGFAVVHMLDDKVSGAVELDIWRVGCEIYLNHIDM